MLSIENKDGAEVAAAAAAKRLPWHPFNLSWVAQYPNGKWGNIMEAGMISARVLGKAAAAAADVG